MAEPIGEILVVIGANYVPQKISNSYVLAYNVNVQSYRDNDSGGASIGSSVVDPRETSSQKGVIIYPSQSKPYSKADLSNLYISAKAGDRFLVQFERQPL